MKLSTLHESRGKGKLPEKVVKAFTDLAHEQRGDPEHAMLRIQHHFAGVLFPVVEHAGDLIHRMTEHAEYGASGYEFVRGKVEKVLRSLTHPYGFEKELEENKRNNAKARDVSEEEYNRKFDKLLSDYAAAHSKLPVYNEVQWLARETCIAIGKQDWNKAKALLWQLDDRTSDPEEFEKFAFEFEMDGGNLKQFRRKS